MSTTQRTIILRHNQINQKILRMAHEIWENNFEANKLMIVGIDKQGYMLAERLQGILSQVSGKSIPLAKISLHKDEPLHHPIELTIDLKELKDANVILVDDVLNSGKTLIYAAAHLLQSDLRKLNTACLVDRRHRRYPVRADIVGLTLSTTLQDHIKVELAENNDTVFLQ